ncbi:MAG: hypothetical protein R3B48_15805 [Kofleriaceae bacterium]
MKNLVLSTIAVALASQAAACIIVDDSEPTGNRLAVTWNYKINEVTQPGCPAGVSDVYLMIQGSQATTADAFRFSCAERTLIAYVADDTYQVWVELGSPTSVYAQSQSLVDDVFGVDKNITFDIHEDRGYFFAQWSLKGAVSNTLLGCTQVSGLNKISLLATKTGTNIGVDTQLDCGPGLGTSLPLLVGFHTVALDAVNSANQTLGGIEIATNQEVKDRNQSTNLGSQVLPIDGL